MDDLNGNWVGTISGTNNGDVFVEIKQTDDIVAGKARIQDRMLGISVYQLTGRIEEDQLFLSLTPETRQQTTTANILVGTRPVPIQIPTIISGNVSVQATIGKNSISGKWESSWAREASSQLLK